MSEHIEAMEQYIKEVVAAAVRVEQERIVALIRDMDIGVGRQMAAKLADLIADGHDEAH